MGTLVALSRTSGCLDELVERRVDGNLVPGQASQKEIFVVAVLYGVIHGCHLCLLVLQVSIVEPPPLRITLLSSWISINVNFYACFGPMQALDTRLSRQINTA